MKQVQIEDRIGKAGGVYQNPVLGLLNGYKLTFNKIATKPKGSGYADVQPEEGSVVYGYAYLMDDKAFELMDGYEACHSKTEFPEGTTDSQDKSHYFRMQVKIQIKESVADSDWKEVNAITYKANKGHLGVDLKPTLAYKDRLLCGKDLLPEDYYKKI